MNKRILIVAGGTGGHLYPGVALARTLKSRGWDPSFAVRRGDLGRSVLEREGFAVQEIRGQGMPRRFSWKGLLFPFQLIAGGLESILFLLRHRPACVIGMGGYLSFPVLVSARCCGIRTMIHEQNVMPGVANRLLGHLVHAVAVSFKDSQRYFRGAPVTVTGIPVRSDMGSVERIAARRLLGLEAQRFTVLVFGGSQGAQRLNSIVVEAWNAMTEIDPYILQVIHITGERDFPRVESLYKSLKLRSLVIPYCHQMPEAYASADLVICRSGASTVGELVAAQRAAILVPFPFASANHQLFNAEILVNAGVAQIVLDADLVSSRLIAFIASIEVMRNKPIGSKEWEGLAEDMHTKDAAERLAVCVETLAQR